MWTVLTSPIKVGIVLGDDEAAQWPTLCSKVMTTEREDEQKFSLPIEYVGMVASDILTIEGKAVPCRSDADGAEPRRHRARCLRPRQRV